VSCSWWLNTCPWRQHNRRPLSSVGQVSFFSSTSNGKVKATKRTRTLQTEKTTRGRGKVCISTPWADQPWEYVLHELCSKACVSHLSMGVVLTYHSGIPVDRDTPPERPRTLYPHPTFGPTILRDPLGLPTIPAAHKWPSSERRVR
jgi:hypothetical protein